MKHKGTIAGLITILLVALTTQALAAEGHSSEHQGGHTEHRHHVALFSGNTHSEGEDGATFGMDYEYRIMDWLGAGILYDYAGEQLDSHVVALPIFLHPIGNVKLLVAPGIEHKHHEDENLLRLGVIYDWHINSYSVSPVVEVDLVHGKASYIYGISVGRGF
jgi:hypothetical protein